MLIESIILTKGLIENLILQENKFEKFANYPLDTIPRSSI